MKHLKRFVLRTIPLPLLIALACAQPEALTSTPEAVTRDAPAWTRDVLSRIDLARTHLTKEAWLAAGLPAEHPAMTGSTAYVRSGYGIAQPAPRETTVEVENDPRIDQVNLALAEARDTFRELYEKGRTVDALELERSILAEAGLGAVHHPDETPLSERIARVEEIAGEVR